MLNSLWVRMTLVFTAIALVVVGAVALWSNRLAGAEFRQYVTHSELTVGGAALEGLSLYYQRQGSWDGVEVLLQQGIRFAPSRFSHFGPISRMRWLNVILADARGRVVFDSAQEPTGRRLPARELANGLPIPGADGETVGYLLVALPRPDAFGPLEQRFLMRVRNVLLAGAGLAVGLALAVSALFSLSLTAPLRRLADAARAVASGDLGQRVSVQGSTEIAEVAESFNEMTAALEKAETLRQNLMADVAHELRTPLSVLQGNLRAILDGVYPLEESEIVRLYDETRLLSRLVDDLRQLALAEAGQLGLNTRPVNVHDLLQDTITKFGPLADSKEVELAVDAPSNLPPAQVDPDRMAQVLGNLFSNALRHTPSGGHVTATAREASNEIEIVVADDGEGIGPEDLQHVFDRFWRADRSRSRESGGSGLGLAIARSIIVAHGGRIWAESEPGQGTRLVFRLPVAKSPS